MTSKHPTIEERLAAVEKELARLRSAVRSHCFQVVDEKGSVCMQMKAERGMGGLSFHDRRGAVRMVLLTEEGSPSVELIDASGVPRAKLGLTVNDNPVLTLQGSPGNTSVTLFAMPDRNEVTIADQAGNIRLGLTLQPRGGGFYLMNEKGTVVWSAGVDDIQPGGRIL